MSPELAAILREEVGIVPKPNEYKQPTRQQALAKGWFNTMNVTFKEDGSWEYNF